MWLLDSRKEWGLNIATAWLPCIKLQAALLKIESENQKSSLIFLPVFFHSTCPYKNYYLKCFTELQTLFNFFPYLVCNVIIGASLSEPHTNRYYEKIAIVMYVCVCPRYVVHVLYS